MLVVVPLAVDVVVKVTFIVPDDMDDGVVVEVPVELCDVVAQLEGDAVNDRDCVTLPLPVEERDGLELPVLVMVPVVVAELVDVIVTVGESETEFVLLVVIEVVVVSQCVAVESAVSVVEKETVFVCDTVAQVVGDEDTNCDWLPVAHALLDCEDVTVMESLAILVGVRCGLPLPVIEPDIDEDVLIVLFATEPVGEAVEEAETLDVSVVVNVLYIVPDDMDDGVVVEVPVEVCDVVTQPVEERDGLVLLVEVIDTDDVVENVLIAEPVGDDVKDVDTLVVTDCVTVPLMVPEFFIVVVIVAVADALFDGDAELDVVVETERVLVPLPQPLFEGEVEPDRELETLPVEERDGLVLLVEVIDTDDVVENVLIAEPVDVPLTVAEFFTVVVTVKDIDGLFDKLGEPERVDETERDREPLAQLLMVAETVPDLEGLALPLVVIDADDVAVKVLLTTDPVGDDVGVVDTLDVTVVVNVTLTVFEGTADGDAVAVSVEPCDTVEETVADFVLFAVIEFLVVSELVADIDGLRVALREFIAVVDTDLDRVTLTLPVEERDGEELPVLVTVPVVVAELVELKTVALADEEPEVVPLVDAEPVIVTIMVGEGRGGENVVVTDSEGLFDAVAQVDGVIITDFVCVPLVHALLDCETVAVGLTLAVSVADCDEHMLLAAVIDGVALDVEVESATVDVFD